MWPVASDDFPVVVTSQEADGSNHRHAGRCNPDDKKGRTRFHVKPVRPNPSR